MGKVKTYVSALCASLCACVLVVGMVPAQAFAAVAEEHARTEAFQARVAEVDAQADTYEPGEMIIVYKDGVSADQQAVTTQSVDDGSETKVLAEDLDDNDASVGSTVRVTLSDDVSVGEAVATAEQDPNVAYAQPNYVYRLLDDVQETDAVTEAVSQANGAVTSEDSSPVVMASDDETVPVDDPYAAVSADNANIENQWWLYSVNAFGAWEQSKASGTVTVAVLDTGINFEHSDLAANIDTEHAYDAYAGEKLTKSPTSSSFSHGSHVAGIVAGVANNGTGIAGVSYNAKILPVQVFYYSSYYQDAVTDDEYLIAAYQYLLGLDLSDLHVINMSLGGYGSADTALETQIAAAVDKDILTVAAGGNGDEYGNPYTTHSWPSDYEEVMSVVALDSSDVRGSWCDYNDSKDISAPGIQIWSTWYTGSTYHCSSGTSMASPLVAGIAALLWAYDPDLTVAEAKEAIYSTAEDLGDEGRDDKYGYGKIDAAAALESLAPAGIFCDSTTLVRTTTEQLEARLLSNTATAEGWTWASSDTSVATVDANGVLTAVAPGTVTITVTATNDATVTGSKTFTVTDIQISGDLLVSPSTSGVTGMHLSWRAAEAATSYDVYRSTTQGSGYTLIATVDSEEGAASYTYDDTTAQSGMAYWYQVRPCGTLDGSTVEGVLSNEARGYFIDQTDLNNLIAKVKADREATKISTDGTDVPTDQQWVTQADDDELLYKLAAAEEVAANEEATLEQTTNAESALSEAWEVYVLAKKYGTKTADASELTDAIAAANEDKDATSVDTDGSSTRQTDQWVTSDVMDTFSSAIAAAQAVADATDATQTQIDQAVSDLQAAQETFDAAKQAGTAATDTTALEAAIAQARADRASVVKSADGTDVPASKQWVTGSTLDTFILAISAANQVLQNDDGSLTQEEADQAAETLKEAQETFDAAKQWGLKQLTDISTAEVSAIADQYWTGQAIEPDVTVVLDGTTLVEGTDYTVAYADNTDAGTATVTITGAGDYTGTVTASFTIVGKHKVVKNATEGGTVTLIDSADGTAATLHPYAGQTVTFRTSPDVGYTLTRMSYTYTDPATGKTVTKALQRISGTGRAGTNAVYSFTMPDADVTLNAEFGVNHRTIHKEIAGEGVLIIQEQADGTAATLYPQPGAKVRFKAIAASGYKLTNIYYTVEGQTKHLALTRVEGTTNVYEFTMPNWDVTLHAVYAMK